MNQEYLSPLFGVSIDPAARDSREPFQRARLADENGLDLITLMDHPYNRNLFETWTLLTALATTTQRIHVKTDDRQPNNIYGPAEHWVERLVQLYRDYRQDTFIFWPVAGNQLLQVEAFAQEVVPAVWEQVKKLAV